MARALLQGLPVAANATGGTADTLLPTDALMGTSKRSVVVESRAGLAMWARRLFSRTRPDCCTLLAAKARVSPDWGQIALHRI